MIDQALALSEATKVKAFFLETTPTEYNRLETLFRAFVQQGADTVILKPPVKADALDSELFKSEAFLAHQAGLNVFVILPTRKNMMILHAHPEWEDLQYDPASGLLHPTGKLDLFDPRAVAALAAYYSEIASYPVDGVFLDEDFYYAENEGLSDAALLAYHKKGGSLFTLKKMLKKMNGDSLDLGESFWMWTELKNDSLMKTYRFLVKAIWSVNASAKVGIPLPGEGLISKRDVLAAYSYDMERFDRLNPDYFWKAVRYRKTRREEGLTYDQSMEFIARTSKGASRITSMPQKVIIAIQTTDRAGRLLPFSEIEEAAAMVVSAKGPLVAFINNGGRQLPPVLTKKIFRWQMLDATTRSK